MWDSGSKAKCRLLLGSKHVRKRSNLGHAVGEVNARCGFLGAGDVVHRTCIFLNGSAKHHCEAEAAMQTVCVEVERKWKFDPHVVLREQILNYGNEEDCKRQEHMAARGMRPRCTCRQSGSAMIGSKHMTLSRCDGRSSSSLRALLDIPCFQNRLLFRHAMSPVSGSRTFLFW